MGLSFTDESGKCRSESPESRRARIDRELEPTRALVHQFFDQLKRGQTALWNSSTEEERHRLRHSFTCFHSDESLGASHWKDLASNPAPLANNHGSFFRFFPPYKKDQKSLFEPDPEDKVVNTYHVSSVSDSPASSSEKKRCSNGISYDLWCPYHSLIWG